MNPDDILYAPIQKGWRQTCREIIHQINRDRKANRSTYRIDRTRPKGALLLGDIMVWVHEKKQTLFWRVDYPDCLMVDPFEFKGVIAPVGVMPFAAFQTWVPTEWRSIEDANLVPNTYSLSYIFANELDARAAVTYLACYYP